ncbi:MAG: hypothetical protein ABJF10_21075 [Chthoniobacter sp.]|uniref:hypothetical protein n=1 Tax=Chthoniobacter sp. TaxID=2510640 RepID=UPI0032A9A1E1
MRWLLLVVASLLITNSQAAPKPTADDIEHMREELGVNGFTAPSIEIILQEIDALKPFPFDKVWRDLPETMPQDRARLALSTGAVIADGFLAVASEKQSRIEPVGRALLRLAKGLGVSDKVSKHSRSILEKAARSQWSDVKQELVRTQAEVESAMMGLKDEEIAHLVALGGWLRALEITSTVAVDDYSPERARRVIQPELLDYFLDRASTFNPSFKKTKLAQTIVKNLQEVKTITTKPVDVPIEKGEVKRVRDLAREINNLVTSDE